MKAYIYKLGFLGPTHFGDTGIDLENVSEWVNSDTLFSALVNVLSSVEESDAVTRFINTFLEKPPFLLSSLFLYFKNQCFLPKPLYDDHIDSAMKKELGKDLKKLKWLDVQGFKKWMVNSGITEDDIEKMKEAQEEYRKSFFIEIRPRVTLDRTTQNSSIYHAGYVHFRKDAGLYGFIAFNDESKINQFKMLLNILGKIGLGGEKTYGCGMFNVIEFQEASDLLKELFEKGNIGYTLLSLYHPSQSEITEIGQDLLAYDVIRKKGWVSSGRYALPLKRKSVGFITEGSVFKRKHQGSLVDVTPDDTPTGALSHGVYRYGYAFTVPLGRIQ